MTLPVKLGVFPDSLLDRQVNELVKYARETYAASDGLSIEAPTVFSALTTLGILGGIQLSFTFTSYSGHMHTEVFRGTTTTFSSATRVGATAANFYNDFPDGAGLTDVYYYWVRNVNLEGTEGTEYGPASGSIGSSATMALELLVGQLGFGQFESGTWPIRSEATLPDLSTTPSNYPVDTMIYLTTNGLLYKNVAWSWVEVVSATDMVGEITETQIADDSISTPKLQTGSVTSNEITANSIIAGKIAAGALVVDDGVMQNLYVKTALIADLAVTTAKIALLAVDTAQIADAAIETAKINDLAVTNAKIGALAVDTAQLADAAITNAKIGALAVDTAQIAAAAITNAKIGSLAVDTLNIANNAVTLPVTSFASSGSLLTYGTSGTFVDTTIASCAASVANVPYIIVGGVELYEYYNIEADTAAKLRLYFGTTLIWESAEYVYADLHALSAFQILVSISDTPTTTGTYYLKAAQRWRYLGAKNKALSIIGARK